MSLVVTLDRETAEFLRFYPQIFFACHRRHVRDEKTRRTLSLNQASILDHLDGLEPTSLHSLARHMGVTPSTMSLNVDRLERAGYLTRRRDLQDARRVELRLTEAGTRIKQQQQKALDPELVKALLQCLNREARSVALHGLKLLSDAAAKITASQQAKKYLSPTASKRRPS